MNRSSAQPLLIGLIGAQGANAAFDAVAVYPIAKGTRWGDWVKEWGKDDLDRLGFPTRFRFVFPIVKGSSALGLLIGLRRPVLGRITATAVVAYFVAALGFHVRARDPLMKYLPAASMLVWACAALLAFIENSPPRSNLAVGEAQHRSAVHSIPAKGAGVPEHRR